MRLTGKQIEEVIEAFVEAFNRASLERFLRIRLDRRLDQLTGGGDLDGIVLDVVAAAERGGWTADLIREAAGWHPGNEGLAALARSTLPQLEADAENPVPPIPAPPIPHIDPNNPPYAALRRLLTSAFDAPGLRRFCRVHEPFQRLLAQFAPGHGVDDMADRLLDYAQIYLLWDELLAGVAEENPYQFEQFVRRLSGGEAR